MKIIVAILLVSLFASFQGEKEKTIYHFTNSQEQFEIVQGIKTASFVNAMVNRVPPDKRYEISLKAKEPHLLPNSSDQKVYTRIGVWQFDFETREKCNSAIDSLLNCFPFDCAKIKKQEDKAIKVTPSIWIQEGKSIYIARTACEQVDNKWETFKKDFAEAFASNQTEIIVTECGKLIWTTKAEIINN